MLIAHLDADCFYVSAERVRDRFLDSKPVGVLGNQGACVIAKSYEMKRRGVTTGEPIWDAVRKCPEGLYLKRDFRWYEVISREMLSVVREFSPLVEFYSIDEFFLTVDAEPQPFALEIQQAILQRVGVPVTIGVARTKTLAKLVSDLAKPFGALALVGREAEEKLLAARPVNDITGIAGRSAKKLAAHGIKTCLDFAHARPSLIRSILTVVGERLCYELNGERCLRLLTSRPPHKNISRGGSIGRVSDDPAYIWAWVVRNIERLIEALEFHGIVTGKLLTIFEYKNGLVRSALSTLTPSARFDLLLDAVRHVWPVVLIPQTLLYRMHLIANDLQFAARRQLGLFDPPPEQDAAIRRIKRESNAKHGRFAVRSAATLPLAEIYIDESHGYEVCDIHGKTCF
jgi:DNA polymerase V